MVQYGLSNKKETAVQFQFAIADAKWHRGKTSFARRQPPIQPVLDASFLLMQRSGTHALCVKLTGSHLPVLPVLLRAYCIVYGGKNQAEINIFLLIPAIFSCLSKNVENAASNLLSIIQLSLQISRLYLTS